MALYDTVTLILEGTAADGSPLRWSTDRQVSTLEVLTLQVDQADILTFIDGHMDVYYHVTPFSRRSRAFVRALLEKTSAHLALRVRRGAPEKLLPVPIVSAMGAVIADGGLLDPDATQATLQAPLYNDIAKGDDLTYLWKGTASTRTRTYKVMDGAKPPADYADRDFIVKNTGGQVVTSYSVRRGGFDPVLDSEVSGFNVLPTTLCETFEELEIGLIGDGRETATMKITSTVSDPHDGTSRVNGTYNNPPYQTGKGLFVYCPGSPSGKAPLRLVLKKPSRQVTLAGLSQTSFPAVMRAYDGSGELLDEIRVPEGRDEFTTVRWNGKSRIEELGFFSPLGDSHGIYIFVDNVTMEL
jgi:hypothetical protein